MLPSLLSTLPQPNICITEFKKIVWSTACTGGTAIFVLNCQFSHEGQPQRCDGSHDRHWLRIQLSSLQLEHVTTDATSQCILHWLLLHEYYLSSFSYYL